jgi:hypothetical protein
LPNIVKDGFAGLLCGNESDPIRQATMRTVFSRLGVCDMLPEQVILNHILPSLQKFLSVAKSAEVDEYIVVPASLQNRSGKSESARAQPLLSDSRFSWALQDCWISGIHSSPSGAFSGCSRDDASDRHNNASATAYFSWGCDYHRRIALFLVCIPVKRGHCCGV